MIHTSKWHLTNLKCHNHSSRRIRPNHSRSRNIFQYYHISIIGTLEKHTFEMWITQNASATTSSCFYGVLPHVYSWQGQQGHSKQVPQQQAKGVSIQKELWCRSGGAGWKGEGEEGTHTQRILLFYSPRVKSTHPLVLTLRQGSCEVWKEDMDIKKTNKGGMNLIHANSLHGSW